MRKQRVLSIALAGLTALVLMLGAVGVSAAASPFQPPLTALSKEVSGGFPSAGHFLAYRISFSLAAEAKNVAVEDNFLDGLSYNEGTAFILGPGGTLVEVQTAQHQNRETWEFRLGDLPAGDYEIFLDASIPSNKRLGQSVKNTVSFYIAGGWKGKAERSSKIVPAP